MDLRRSYQRLSPIILTEHKPSGFPTWPRTRADRTTLCFGLTADFVGGVLRVMVQFYVCLIYQTGNQNLKNSNTIFMGTPVWARYAR